MKRRKHPIRWAALLLCLCMLLPLANLMVFADEAYPYLYPDGGSKPYYQMSMYAYQQKEEYDASNWSYATGIMRLLDTENGNQQVLAYCADSDVYDKYVFL